MIKTKRPDVEHIEAFLKELWSRREQDLPIPEFDFLRPITKEEIEYLINRYPFLQIINTINLYPDREGPKFVTARSGWVIHDYGDAISSSPGEFLYGGGDFDAGIIPSDKEEGGDEGGEGGAELVINGGHGTFIKQLFDTAYEMIEMAVQKGWPVAEVVNGTERMKWAAWMAAQDNDFPLDGFEPTEEQKVKRARILKLLKAAKIKPKKAAKSKAGAKATTKTAKSDTKSKN